MLSSTDPSQRTWISVNGRLPGKGADVASLILTFSDSGFHQLNILKQQNWKVVPNVLVQGWTRGNTLIPWRPRLHGQPWLTIASFTHEQRIMMRWPLSHPWLRNSERSIPSRWRLWMHLSGTQALNYTANWQWRNLVGLRIYMAGLGSTVLGDGFLIKLQMSSNARVHTLRPCLLRWYIS